MNKIFTLLIISFAVITIKGQDNNLFNRKDYAQDVELLEGLVCKKLDSLRHNKKREKLVEDAALKTSAKNHLLWVNRTGKIVHFEDVKETKTPIKRARKAGYKEKLIGENLADTFYNKEQKTEKGVIYMNQSLEDIASDLVNNIWRHSKGHYKNIIGKEFKDHGVAIVVDTKLQKVYAMQVLGGVVKRKKH